MAKNENHSFIMLQYILGKTWFFLNKISLSKPVLWASGTAQIGEGLQNSWADFEESEMEDEDGQDEPLTVEDQNIEMGDVHIGTKNQKG